MAGCSVVSFALLATGLGFAQEPIEDLLPVVPKPLGEAPAAFAFGAVVREPGPRGGKADMQVSLWEVLPGKPAVRRTVLGRSPWSAAPLLDSPILLRWQVPAFDGGRGYSVQLLRVDGERFTTSELLGDRQVQAIGRAGDRVYLRTSRGQRLLDLANNSITPLETPIKRLAFSGHEWLVELDDVVARFDAAATKVLRRYPALAAAPPKQAQGYTDWDGGRFAVRRGRFVDASGQPIVALEFGAPSIVYRELRVWDLQAGTESKVRVRMQARGGSGVGVIPAFMHTELVGGMFRYTERRPAEGEHADLDDYDEERDTEWVTIDIATGKEMLRKGYEPRDVQRRDPLVAHAVPDYLAEAFAESPVKGWGAEQQLAAAFLEDRGIEVRYAKGGTDRLEAACRSPDGNRLLVYMVDTLYACDLKARSLTSWQAPAEWRRAAVELIAVPTRSGAGK